MRIYRVTWNSAKLQDLPNGEIYARRTPHERNFTNTDSAEAFKAELVKAALLLDVNINASISAIEVEE